MKWKKFAKNLLFPPLWVIIILSIISVSSLTIIFVKGLETSAVAYSVYVISFYWLCVVCTFFSLIFPKHYKIIKEKALSYSFINKLLIDKLYRAHISLYASLAVNILYVAINIFSGICYKTAWFGILAVYYFILAFMRFLLIKYSRQHIIGTVNIPELKNSRSCGYILIILNIVLCSAVLMIVYKNKGYEYNGILIYVAAMYTFFATTQAIINIVKFQRYNSPVMTTAKIVSLSSALVSVIALETAMFAQFGQDMSQNTQKLMIILTSIGISIIIETMAIFIIIKTTKEIRKLKG